jgi:hypothetical protein
MSILTIGTEEHGAVIKPLSDKADEYAAEEKRREGVKPDAGRRRRVVE